MTMSLTSSQRQSPGPSLRPSQPQYLRHHRLRLALHRLKDGDGHPLLLLHGLGERSPAVLPAEYAGWPGPIHALDFTGHGDSDLPRGGGYSCEFLMADADIALAHLGPCTVAGRGIGGYVALLLAGARPGEVRGAIVRDGPGLSGGGSAARSPYIPVPDLSQPAPPDPFAIAELANDVRPPSYASSFAMLASQHSDLDTPICVCCCERPPWLAAVMELLSLEPVALDQALRQYARVPAAGTRPGLESA
ncbi:alpha/beta hydrolase [Cupriavidus gilardii]|uniref:alpha/beta fold hydrolase n=2 Tax=Cupriavidus gilardii TaxID=82541 RepID=UPI0006CB09F5|nr:alpha/beta hydrolase [Cupriavidus gilardii]ALD92490.1 alpha/beta hydrolase [Cupriavidus gilardii CR3]MCT9016608.1 alpha/beta hydrolase [Cupriavidus gilardii]MCT9117267.1 alpha/beta hydrolase [Cupriavidus gilardii]